MLKLTFACGILVHTLAFGTPFTSIGGNATVDECGVNLPFQTNGHGQLNSGNVDTGFCQITNGNGPPLTGEAQVHAFANPLGSYPSNLPFDVGGYVDTTSNGPEGLGSGVEADGFFLAISSDTITLNSPLINYTGGVDVVVGSNYTLDVAFVNSLNAASSQVSFNVPVINGTPVTFPAQGQQMLNHNGHLTGQIQDEFTILACPCSFTLLVMAQASADDGALADATDPFFIQLPPGWTYTTSSQAAAVPEPASLIFIVSGLIGLGAAVQKCRAA